MEKQAIMERADKQTPMGKAGKQAIIKILEENPEQNALILERLRHNYYADAASEGKSVRIFDTLSGYYMFSASNCGAFHRLYHSAAQKPDIFFLADDLLRGELERIFRCILLEQWIMPLSAPAPVPENPHGFLFEPLVEQDIDYVEKTYQSSEFGRHYLRERILRGPTLCVRRNGRLMGYMLTHADGETGPLYVPPENRGLGLGYQLICRISSVLQADNTLPIGLIYPENEVSRRLHSRAGYAQCKRHAMWVYPRA